MASADDVRASSYSHTINAQSTWSEIKVVPNAFDTSNATASFIEANRCDGGSATCSSGEVFIEVDFTVQFSSNSTRADVRWSMVAPESTPPDAMGIIEVYNQTTGTWQVVATDTTISGSAQVTEIALSNHALDGSQNIDLRLSVRHNGTTFPADELAMYFYGIYDVRVDVVDADGDGILDENDDCPNGETGWTSTPLTDHDGDGCRDATEDNDDDNDSIVDGADECEKGDLGWTSSQSTDNDNDGCQDLVEDEDDDNDGFNDTAETLCNSDPLDALSTPTNDLDGDGLCDAQDPDIDGDGWLNTVETNDSVYIDANQTGTNPFSADTDGDGHCDGDETPAQPVDVCQFLNDAFPNDGAAYSDTDDDGEPDELWGTSTTGLTLDLDDDDDGWSDEDELNCGNTNSKDAASYPVDGDNDGVCDLLDTLVLAYQQNGTTFESFEAYVGQTDFSIVPHLTGMQATSWEFSGTMPNELTFDEGAITGEVMTELDELTFVVFANNSQTGISLNATVVITYLENHDGDGLPDGPSANGLAVDEDDDNDGVFDVDDACPKGEIGLSEENDTDGDGCRDLFEFDLASIAQQTNLTFYENFSSPLPGGCLLRGTNNSILECSTLGDLGRSTHETGFSLSDVCVLATENKRVDYIDGQWYDVCPGKDGVDVKIPRSNPFPALDTTQTFQYVKGVAIDEECICRSAVFDLEVEFIRPSNLPDGVNLRPENGYIWGIPESVEPLTPVDITVRLADDNNIQRGPYTMKFTVIDKAPVFDQTHSAMLDFNNQYPQVNLNGFNRGGDVTRFSYNSLPSGLEIDQDGILNGVSKESISEQSYTIYYENSGGNGSFNLTLTVVQPTVENNETPWMPYALLTFLVLVVLAALIARKKPPEANNPPNIHIGELVNIGKQEVNQELQLSAIEETHYHGSPISITSGGDSVVAIGDRAIAVGGSIQPDSVETDYAQWALDLLSREGPRKIGDSTALNLPPTLKSQLADLPADRIFTLEVTFAAGYPDYFAEQGEFLGASVLSDFLRVLYSIGGGKGQDTLGGYTRTTDKDEIELVFEKAVAFTSSYHSSVLAQHIGLLRTGVWDYCEKLKQESVHVKIGSHARFVNPLPATERDKISSWLNATGRHIDISGNLKSSETKQPLREKDLSY